MNKETFIKLLEKAKTDKYGNLYVVENKDKYGEQRIYFGTITTVCDDLIEQFCGETDDGFELYDRHFLNDDTLECQIVNVGKLKSRDDEEEEMDIFIQLRNKDNGQKSNRIKLEDIIFNSDEIEFEFGEFGTEDYETLPYKDFIFFKDNFELIKIVEYQR